MIRPVPPLPGPTPMDEFKRQEERRQQIRRAEDQKPERNIENDLQELRALASTVRQCQRNGHPDLTAHLDALLKKLGA